MNDLSESFVRKLLSVQDVAVNKPSRLGQFLVNRPQKTPYACVLWCMNHLISFTWQHSRNGVTATMNLNPLIFQHNQEVKGYLF